MKLFRTRTRKPSAPTHALRRRLEALEDRAVPATLSIADATAIEGDHRTAFLGTFVPSQPSGLDFPKGISFHGGDLFVASAVTNSVLRYGGASGNALGEFVHPGDGGLSNPFDLAFGPDGDLYVSSIGTNEVLRYDGATGAYEGGFVTAGSGGLSWPRGIAFGADGNLYVASQYSHHVLRYQGPAGPSPGAFMGVFAATDSVRNPFGLAFGPDGNLYVAYVPSDQDGAGSVALGVGYVNRYDGSTGAFIDTFVPTGTGGLSDARHVIFDAEGNLLLPDGNLDGVLRFQGPNGSSPGAFLNALVPAGLGGLRGPHDMAFDPDGNLYVVSAETDSVLRYGPGSTFALIVSLSSASATPVTVGYTTSDGSAAAGSDYVAASGTITFAPGETSHTILVRTLDDALSEPAEAFVVTLSDPVGATIADGQGTGTIMDDDTTKFFVVDDAAADRTYRYGLPGTALGSSASATGNTTPRGAASTAAGDRVWVVDANKTVYVYNASGGLLGAWSAGGLPKNAQVEGIATNGTDVWLLDNRQDRVFKYAGAAGHLSGSQNAASSFSLNSGNSNGKGIVTDGTSFWVVNDGTTDRVYKYSLTGGLLGSWAIDPANASPTGLTIDPANVSDIWIVDNGTDRVYQYTAAAGRTSGSQIASATFALAAGNTNPQDIADPPASDTQRAAAKDTPRPAKAAEPPLAPTPPARRKAVRRR
jgi:hypothetical protein